MTGQGLLWLAVGTTLAGCGSAAPLSVIPEIAPEWPALATVTDENPANDILDIRLDAGEASKTFPGTPPSKLWAYNGTVPGPLIDAAIGSELIVRFTNHLPEPTTIHWHGVRVPASMDGTLAVQSPVLPGSTFEYRFPLQDSGLFWFHPHIRSDVQIEKGLYGVIRVRGPNEPPADHEGILVLDDIRVLPDGTLPTYLDDESKMLGRQGNVLLVNGRTMSSFPPVAQLDDGPADEQIVLGEGIQNGDLVFTINGTTYPDVSPIGIPTGATKRFDVRNDTEMDHPFHIHGVFFQNLATNGQVTSPDAIVAKDTIIAPQMTTLRLVARFDEPGAWMYHCHIPEHAEGGMMGEIHVQ